MKHSALNLSAYSIIRKKRNSETLTREEIEWFVNSLVTGEVADYQASALMMAIYLNGFETSETAALTETMLKSGKWFQFNDVSIVDKHSTGGVGDKTSFILAPIAAACGVKVPMIAGRGLGHTGGTVDKIESIPGFKTDLSLDDFEKILLEKGLVLIGQTKDIAPADGILYSLRDVTATIESIPLITASIMSKKLAEGANGIVLDIKYGNGAFMESFDQAKELSESLCNTGQHFKKNMMSIISDMNQPLGHTVGNSLEIIECIETLKGNGPKDLTEISLELAAGMIYLANKSNSIEEAREMALKSIEDGSAFNKFKELIDQQKGDSSYLDDIDKFDIAPEKTQILSTRDGYVSKFNTKQIGLHSVSLGGGRSKRDDIIDYSVGLIVHKKIGDKVAKGDCLVEVFHHKSQETTVAEIQKSLLENDITISNENVEPPKLIMDTQIYRSPTC